MNEINPRDRVNKGLYIQLLGGFVISVDDRPVSDGQQKSRRARSLIKQLALAPGHRLHRDQVIDLFWPDADIKAAENNFHQVLHNARLEVERTGAAVLVLEGGLLTLAAGEGKSLAVDVDLFEAAAARAKNSPDPQDYQAALALYSGDLLPEDLYEEWTIARRESLRQTYLKLLLNLSQRYEAQQDFQPAIEVLQRLLSADPGGEEAHARLMRLYAQSGQRQQALRQYQTLKDILYNEMEIEPSESTARLYQDILAGRIGAPAAAVAATPYPANPAQPDRRTHNLPRQLTTLIGREKEIQRAKSMLLKHSLVTISGAGGVGKTRLALAVAGDLSPDSGESTFPDGVWFVELAPVTDPHLVVRSVAEVLSLREQPGLTLQTSLLNHLQGKRLLLVIDNCEHLIDACAELFHTLLRASPGLKVLAASREPLGVPGEGVLPLATLEIPEAGKKVDLARLEQVEAVRLFIDRAQAGRPDFELSAQNAAALVEICHHVDGNPLAIELAASRVASMEVGQIAARLGSTFRLLAGENRGLSERQQTVRATIDWSYNLLSAEEKLLLQRLSVFSGGWTLEAAEQVCAGEGLAEEDIPNLLAKLVHKSMVMTTFTANYWLQDPLPGYAMRYRLLKTILQYAGEILAVSGDPACWRDRHLDYYMRLAEAVDLKMRSGERLDRMYQLHLEKDNLLGALAWALDVSPDRLGLDGARLANALSYFWERTWFFSEGQAWLEKGLSRLDRDNQAHQSTLAWSLCLTASFRYSLSDWKRAYLEESIRLFRDFNDRSGLAYASMRLGFSYMWNHNFEKARPLLDTSHQLFLDMGDHWSLGELNYALAGYYRPLDPAQFITCSWESIDSFQKSGDRWSSICCTWGLSWYYSQMGNLPKAREMIEATAILYHELDARPFLISSPWHMAVTAYFQQDYPQMEAFSLEGLASLSETPDKDKSTIILTLCLLTVAALRQGKIKPAARYCLDSLILMQTLELNYYRIMEVLNATAAITLAAGLAGEAARLLGAVWTAFEANHGGFNQWAQAEYDQNVAGLHAQIGEAAFQTAWADGHGWALDRAIQTAQAVLEELAQA